MVNVIEFFNHIFYGTACAGEDALIGIISKIDPKNKTLDLTNKSRDIDDVYIRLFDDKKGCWDDKRVLALRVEQGTIRKSILSMCVIDDTELESIASEDELCKILANDSDYWMNTENDSVEYVDTIFHIIEDIEQYIPKEFIPKDIDWDTIVESITSRNISNTILIDEPDTDEDNKSMVVVVVNNTDAKREYTLLVKTNDKTNVINELREGGFFKDETDAEYSTVDENPFIEAINIMSHKCIDLTGNK